MTDLPKHITQYFDTLNSRTEEAYAIAKRARKQGYDPALEPEVQIARTMAERVVGLVSVAAPQIVGSGIAKRISELEKKYGVLDWRIAFVIALEVAQQKYCSFKDEREAMEVGIRIGFAYVTNGVVSSPLEGFVNLEIGDRLDRKGKYFRIKYAGPVRNAGGTAAAVSVLIADYVRKHMGYAEYDATDDEVARCYTEISRYHDRVANLQYFPSETEIDYLVRRMPVEVAGDPTEKVEVTNYKNLPRIPTNKIRSGYCLIYSACIPLKAPKLWKQLSKWGKDMGMEQWNFLDEFIQIQKSQQAHGKKGDVAQKLSPNFTYIADLVAGRPVFGHPLRPGGFRLRYGRSRLSGLSGQAMHPATMIIVNEFIATASQLKVERPGKAAAYTACDELEGPIVRLQSGDVVQVRTSAQARLLLSQVERILFLGDILICYGDFLNRAHTLIPPGYCEEWWVQELREAGCDVPEDLWSRPVRTQVSWDEAVHYSKTYGIPLHPRYVFYYRLASVEQLRTLWEAVRKAPNTDPLVLDRTDGVKEVLESIGVPHRVEKGGIHLEEGTGKALRYCLSREAPESCDDPMEFLQETSPVYIRDKAGVFVGARLGRPEKAKMRSMTGTPHTLFPVGREGGRLRSVNATLEDGGVTTNYEVYYCPACEKEVVQRRCPVCDGWTQPRFHCKECGTTQEESCPRGLPHYRSKEMRIPVREYFDACLRKMDAQVYPDLIKGVRGTMNEDHAVEHLLKGVLRARNEVYVNKDGTIRYDASEVPVTHFRPREIGITAEIARSLGYVADIHGEPIVRDDQVIEMFAQDVILPACDESPDERSDTVLLRTTQFIDELLVHLYGLEPYYNATSTEDLIGHLVVALAPHTSAGTIGRIIGFTKTQGLFYHPYLHCATRRDCFSAETSIPVCKDGVWSIERIGDVVERLHPSRLVDAHGTREARPENYATLGLIDGQVVPVPVTAFTKHTAMPMVMFRTKLGRELRTTANHKHVVVRDGQERIIRSHDLRVGDVVKAPYRFAIPQQDVNHINLLEELHCHPWLMIRGLRVHIPDLRRVLIDAGVSVRLAENYAYRDSVPAHLVMHVIRARGIDVSTLRVAAKRDRVSLPAIVPVTDEFLAVVGLYVVEGFARHQQGSKGSYQVYIAAQNPEIRQFVRDTFASLGLAPSERKLDRVTYSSRILYELFISLLGAGRSAYEKRIPQRFLCLPKERAGRLLSGYFEGDGSVSSDQLRIVFDTVSQGLLRDIEFVMGRFGIFVKFASSTRFPGRPLQEFYERNGREVPAFRCYRGTIQSKFVHQLSEDVSFISTRNAHVQQQMLGIRFKFLQPEYDEQFFYDEIVSIEEQPSEETYCLTVPNSHVVANGVLTRQCDGDEGCVFLVMDAFLNFSKRYLPSTRGGTMDAPLVLSTVLIPAEVDDMVFDMDIVWRYPLSFYQAACAWKKPWEVEVKHVSDVLGRPEEFFGFGFTHDTADVNDCNRCSAYKTLPTMQEKLMSQMDLAEKISAVDERDVARLVIEKHFIRDLRGNLRKFSMQSFRCVQCNTIYRRPPLRGSCSCNGRIIFTISEGSVVKYLTPAESLVQKYNLDTYLAQSIELTRRRVEEVFGKDPEKQLGLGEWFS